MTKQRRAPGEGSIYPIRNKAGEITGYAGSIDLTVGIDGKRRRRRARGKTKTEVANKLRELRKQADAGVDLGTPRQTLAQFLAHWLKDVVLIRNSPKTHASYSDVVRLYIIPHIGHIRLDQLTQKHIQAMATALVQQPNQKRPGTLLDAYIVRRAVHILKAALNRAKQERLIAYNPAELVELPRTNTRKIQAFSEADARRFLQVVSGHRLEALWWILMLCGLRKGEVLALVWSDVDFEQKLLSVSKSYQKIGKEKVTGKPKTSTGNRLVPLPDVLITLLREHQRRQGEEKYSVPTYDRIFVTRTGTPIDPSNLWAQFKSLLKKAGLPAATRVHDLRHTCATLLLDAGENPRNVAALLGHSKTSTTLDIYGHSVAASQAKGIEALGERLKGDKNEG